MWANDTFNNFMSEAALPEGGKPIITVNCGSNLDHNGDGRQWIVYASYANTAGAWGMELQGFKKPAGLIASIHITGLETETN